MYSAAVMSAIRAKIAQIIDGFRQGHVQFEETVSLLDSYLETLPTQAHGEFFETLWIEYGSERISHLNSKRTVHALVVRAWSASGPADGLPARLFAQSIEHPNVLKIVDKNLDAERPYFVAELCQRGSLEKVGTSPYKGNIRATVDVLLPIADALVAAHQINVFHRDIKPANILFRGDGTPVVGISASALWKMGEPVTFDR